MALDPYETARQSQERTARRRRRRLRAAAGVPPCRAAPAASLAGGSPTQAQGRAAERRAARHLASHGLRLIACNLRCRAGEIDLVAREADILVFIEVRERHDARYGGPLASVNRLKQARLVRAAQFFLPRLTVRHFGGRTPACRFDVVGFDGGRPRWIRAAFGADAPGSGAGV